MCRYFLEKNIAEQTSLCAKMSNKKISETLLELLDRIYDENPSFREFINTSLEDICRDKNVSPHQLFSILSRFYLLLFLS